MAERFANFASASRNNSLQATNAFSSTYSDVLARMKLPSWFQTCDTTWRKAPCFLKAWEHKFNDFSPERFVEHHVAFAGIF